ncbi:type II toxin-antitoxin system VapC family toxin [Sphingomonas oligophenolica]|uniref:Type II toxin-antitoxin system VapC family toxin n=1 Tax=Sphingomonas oligophenolica TaxID=301154 RepID=A0A502CIJ4_9SPHN|nr:type II toxin-antitoxin system VapC family toxin [Sphingomonas oligophenolica]TPG12470.1 type II toxin-antitoxin system VapC family toxin [Sphingomonas oligophenolica]
MNLFVDASAMVAMLTLEDDFEELGDRLDIAEHRMTSAMAIWETTIALSIGRGIMMDFARQDVTNFIAARGVAIVPIGEKEADAALEAHRRFGKGRHPARLNMGDCFAYACARTNDARLLYKGTDFSKTDLA